jgi:hypothetical protein
MFAPPVAKPTTKPAELQRATVSAQRPSHSAVEQVHMLQPSIAIQAQQAGPSWDFAKIPVFPWGGAERFRPSPLFPAARLPIQAKLEIGAVDDPLEHEADRVAEQVMRMPDPGVSIAAAPSRVNPKCAQCEEEEKLQTKQAGSQSAGGEAPSIVHEALRAPGQPLDAATRDYFEPRFGRDFSRVRVHTDAKAAESARTLDARAYTLGSDIVFASNAFSPATSAGRRLLAHELVHTAQQRDVPVRQVPLVSSPADFAEREADAVAESALAGQSMSLSARPPAGQVLRDTKEYQTAGIPLDPVEMEKWSTRSYWEKKVLAVLAVTTITPADTRLNAAEERDAVFSVLWNTYQSLKPIKTEIRRPVTIPARGTAAPGTAAPGAATPAAGQPGTPTPGTAAPGTGGPGTPAPGTKTPGAPATSSAAPALAYLFIFRPPDPAGKDKRDRVEVRFVAEGAGAAAIAAPAAAAGATAPRLSFRSFPKSSDPKSDDFTAFFEKFPDEGKQLFTFLAGAPPTGGQLVTTSSTVGKTLHETTVSITPGPVVEFVAESKPVGAAPPSGYAGHDYGDLKLEEAGKDNKLLGKITLPAAMPGDEIIPVKYTIWQYFQTGTRNAEVDAIVPMPGTPPKRVFYTLKFHGGTNDVDVVRIGEEGTAGTVELAKITFDLARIPDYAAHSNDVTALSAWLRSRYLAITPAGADVPAMKSAAEKAIETGAVKNDWFKNNYGMEELDKAGAAARLSTAQDWDPQQVKDTQDFVPNERRLLERAFETLSDHLLALLKGVPLARQKVFIEKGGSAKAPTYTPVPKTMGDTATQTTTVGGKVTKVDRTIVFYDSWFMSDQSLFTGGTGTIAPASVETPLHEFGHVVGAQAGIKDAFEKTFTAAKAKFKTAPITWYAKSDAPKEFFAEAFALFHADPVWMKTNLPDMFAWFQTLSDTGKPPPP